MKPEDTSSLLKKLNISDAKQIGEEMGKELVEKVQSGEITKEEWDYLKAVVPRFAEVVSAGLTTIGSVASATTAVQTEALKAMREGIAAAKEIASKSTDPEVHKLALRSIDKAFERIENMNKDNNSWGGVVIAALVTVVGIGAYVVSGGRIKPPTIA